MQVLSLPIQHPEQVTIGHRRIALRAVLAGEAFEDVHAAQLLIDDVFPIRHHNRVGKRHLAIITCQGSLHVRAVFETRAGRAPGHHDAGFVEAIEVRVADGLDDGPALARGFRDGGPVPEGVVVEVARGVEGPVTGSGDNGFNRRDIGAREKHAGTDHVGLGRVGDDQLREGSALRDVVDAAVVIDLEGLDQDTLGDVHGRLVLGVIDFAGEGNEVMSPLLWAAT